MSLINKIKDAFALSEDYLFEMANISADETGLSADIWVDQEGKNRKVSHRNVPRVKIKKNKTYIPISIEKHPRIVADISDKNKDKIYRDYRDVFDFVGNHYETLEKHFNKQLNDRQLFIELEKEGAFK